MGLLDMLMGRSGAVDQNAVLQKRMNEAGVGQQAPVAVAPAPVQAQPPGQFSMQAFMQKIEADRQIQQQAAAQRQLQESGMRVLPPSATNRGFE